MRGYSNSGSSVESQSTSNQSSAHVQPFAVDRYPEFNFTDIDSLYVKTVKKQKVLLGFFSVIAVPCVLVLLFAILSLLFPSYEIKEGYFAGWYDARCSSLFDLLDDWGHASTVAEARSRAYCYLFGHYLLPCILIPCIILVFPILALVSVKSSRKRWNVLRDSDYIQVSKHSKYLFILKDNQFGLVDRNYNVIIVPEYDYMKWHTEDKYLTVTKDHRTFVINLNGKEML